VDGTLRERAQPFEILRSELVRGVQSVARPATGLKSSRFMRRRQLVVIATDEHASQSLRFCNDFIRIAPVADRISEIDDEVRIAGAAARQESSASSYS